MLTIDDEKCFQCGGCVPLCPIDALFLSFRQLECDHHVCTLCGICIKFCPNEALEIKYAK
jgi:pyruvate formate lyase activating enzyme